jgi:4-hydroxy-tetrahydrodipicolinate synthase
MNANKIFKGTGVAIVTPFNAKGLVDFKSIPVLVDHIIKGKVDYLVALGTTGESATLSEEEKVEVLNCIVGAVKKRVPVVLGQGGNNTLEVVRGFANYDFSNIAAVLSVSPYYNKPSQQGIFEHYQVVAKESPRPVILYNVPGRTSSNISAETTLRIANEVENVIGMKEASGNIEQCMRIIQRKPKKFLLISGDDALTLPLIASGADGVISVVANAYPLGFSEMVRQALAGNLKKAQVLHYKHLAIIEQMFADGNPAGVKEFLALLKICENHVRLPLVRVNKQVQDKIKSLF